MTKRTTETSDAETASEAAASAAPASPAGTEDLRTEEATADAKRPAAQARGAAGDSAAPAPDRTAGASGYGPNGPAGTGDADREAGPAATPAPEPGPEPAAEPAHAAPTQAQPTQAETVGAETVGAETVAAETVAAETADPQTAQAQPAPPPPAPAMSPLQALPYMFASVLLAISQGLGQGFVTVNIPQFSGDLGVTTTQGTWLLAAYMIPRASLPLMLIKIRTQFGLRRFAEVGIAAYVIVAFGALWITDLRSAVIMQFLSGVAAAPLATLAFLYMLEPLAPQWKLKLGLPMVLALLFSGTTIARLISPSLIGDGFIWNVHLVTLGLAMLSLAMVYLLPLRPVPHAKVIQPLDLVSFGLIATGFGGMTVAFVMGPIHWWDDAVWIGWLLAGCVVCLIVAAVIELHRETPLLDLRWIASPPILHLTGTLMIFRLVLSEQTSGAPRMFQTMGLAPEQMTPLFAVIVLATFVGVLASVAYLTPKRVPAFQFVALVLIATGAWMDSQSSMLTRPEQMYISQALIAFAGMLCLPPAMMSGFMSALAKGPSYILSFVIVFLSTQSLGAVAGAGLFTTIINHRQAAHLQHLREQIQTSDPLAQAEVARNVAALLSQQPDAAARSAQAVYQLSSTVSSQAYVMAYNDAYSTIFLIATVAASALLLHVLRDWMVARSLRQTEVPA
ncbi:MFS transporter [Maritimibacter alkaliphilus]|uniref:MFS transporter n=1 Tax=Maritimibacter alkaliphilus TaxID=404236 RepID=UPI0021BD591E|nr:MFS transporter [Maritimibacter alkaliphilus]